MVGGIIISSLKKAGTLLMKGAKGAAKIAKAGGKRFVGSSFAKGVKESIVSLGKRMATKRWWGRAVRVIRNSRSIVATVGAVGAALKKRGGLLGFLGKGLSIFNADTRSPREFRRDMVAKESELKRLRAKRDNLIQKSQEAQKELNAPITLEGVEGSEAKIDALSVHLNSMKKALKDIKATSYQSASTIKGFESYQVKANEQLADAINNGSEANMKTVMAGLEETKDATTEIVMNSTETIVGDISAKMDAIEAQKREEEEFRRKNNWKKKLLDGVLFIADWWLNWPFKLAMIALKLGAVIVGGLTIYLLPYFNKIGAMIWAIKNGLGLIVSGIIGLKLMQMGSWIVNKLSLGFKWLYGKILDIIFGIRAFILNALSNIPGLKGMFEYLAEKDKALGDAAKAGMDSMFDFLTDKSQEALNFSKNKAAEIMDGLEKAYHNSKKKEEKKEVPVSGTDLVEGSKDQIKGRFDQAEGSLSPSTSEDSPAPKEEENKKGLFQKVGDYASSTAKSGLNSIGGFIETNQVPEKLEAAKENTMAVAQGAITKTKVLIEKSGVKETLSEGVGETERSLEKVSSEVRELKNAVKESLLGKDNQSSPASSTNVREAQTHNFKGSASQYEALIQES
jgi:hypothetical protein